MIIAHNKSKLYGSLLSRIHSVCFFGVPHRGSDSAYWGYFAARLLEFGQLGFGTNSTYVSALRRNSTTFANISQQFIDRGSMLYTIRTYYETERMGNQWVSCPRATSNWPHRWLNDDRLWTKIPRYWDFRTKLPLESRSRITERCARLIKLKVKSTSRLGLLSNFLCSQRSKDRREVVFWICHRVFSQEIFQQNVRECRNSHSLHRTIEPSVEYS